MAAFDYDLTVEEGRTEITITGTQEAAVVVRSGSGERIYLPPEGFSADVEASPYQSAESDSSYQSASDDSPYQSVESDSPYQSAPSDSPYQSADDDSPYQSIRRGPGVSKTSDGFRIHHPEPITEFHVYR